jgi:hypothetical protein
MGRLRTGARTLAGGDDSAVAGAVGGVAFGVAPGETGCMGFDPTRKHKRTPFDYVYVAAGVVVCVALVVWALVG